MLHLSVMLSFLLYFHWVLLPWLLLVVYRAINIQHLTIVQFVDHFVVVFHSHEILILQMVSYEILRLNVVFHYHVLELFHLN